MSNLLSAIQCGRTNVATMILQGSGSDILYGEELGFSSKQEHHSISHKKDEEGLYIHSQINRYAIDQVAKFAKALDSIPEDGGTMLDNSIVAISYELGQGRGHVHHNVPHIIFGKAGQQFKSGQYLKFGDEDGNGGISVNDILLTHCRAMGIDNGKVSKVGLESVASGKIVDKLLR